jgi:hypothetical protein
MPQCRGVARVKRDDQADKGEHGRRRNAATLAGEIANRNSA